MLPLIPLNVAAIGAAEATGWQAVELSARFVFGAASALALLGLASDTAGFLLIEQRGPALLVCGFIMFYLGLVAVEVASVPFAGRSVGAGRRLGSIAAGAAFALVTTPCASPLLGAVLAASAAQQVPGLSVISMLAFSVGYTALVFVAGVFGGTVVSRLRGQAFEAPRAASAALLMAAGLGFAVTGVPGSRREADSVRGEALHIADEIIEIALRDLALPGRAPERRCLKARVEFSGRASVEDERFDLGLRVFRTGGKQAGDLLVGRGVGISETSGSTSLAVAAGAAQFVEDELTAFDRFVAKLLQLPERAALISLALQRAEEGDDRVDLVVRKIEIGHEGSGSPVVRVPKPLFFPFHVLPDSDPGQIGAVVSPHGADSVAGKTSVLVHQRLTGFGGRVRLCENLSCRDIPLCRDEIANQAIDVGLTQLEIGHRRARFDGARVGQPSSQPFRASPIADSVQSRPNRTAISGDRVAGRALESKDGLVLCQRLLGWRQAAKCHCAADRHADD